MCCRCMVQYCAYRDLLDVLATFQAPDWHCLTTWLRSFKISCFVYHVCRPTWKGLSQCPCQVPSLLLAVCCSWDQPASRVQVSCPDSGCLWWRACGLSHTGTVTRSWPDASTWETINNWYVSSLNAIAKEYSINCDPSPEQGYFKPLQTKKRHLHKSRITWMWRADQAPYHSHCRAHANNVFMMIVQWGLGVLGI